MPYTAPTVEQFTARFPEYASVAPQTITDAIQEANRQVDTTWMEGDYQPAIMYLAAHIISSASIASQGREVSAERIGPLSVSYFKFSEDQLANTDYGKNYRSLLRRNIAGIDIV